VRNKIYPGLCCLFVLVFSIDMVNSGTFRGGTGHSAEEYCAAMGVLQTAKSSGENIYEMVQQVFQRETPRKNTM